MIAWGLSCEYAQGDLVLTGWVIIWSAPCNMDSGWEWKCLAFSPVHGSPLVCLERKRSSGFRVGFRRDGVPAQLCMWLNSPVSIHSGGTILHFCLCLRLRANHTGTSTGRPGLNGPRSPWKFVYNSLYIMSCTWCRDQWTLKKQWVWLNYSITKYTTHKHMGQNRRILLHQRIIWINLFFFLFFLLKSTDWCFSDLLLPPFS